MVYSFSTGLKPFGGLALIYVTKDPSFTDETKVDASPSCRFMKIGSLSGSRTLAGKSIDRLSP
jgi:hypothetical protein